jgi:uncharacterized membrane protein
MESIFMTLTAGGVLTQPISLEGKLMLLQARLRRIGRFPVRLSCMHSSCRLWPLCAVFPCPCLFSSPEQQRMMHANFHCAFSGAPRDDASCSRPAFSTSCRGKNSSSLQLLPVRIQEHRRRPRVYFSIPPKPVQTGLKRISMKSPLLNHPPKSTRSFTAVAGHPLHPMLVAFPIAYVIGAFASDVAFWLTGDPFWARVSLWVIGIGLAMGSLAAIAGMLDFMLVREIRHHVTSWSHFLAAVMLLALMAANWWMRVPDPGQGLLPWGIFLSGISAVSLTVAGWLGGRLVFEHNVGTGDEQE